MLGSLIRSRAVIRQLCAVSTRLTSNLAAGEAPITVYRTYDDGYLVRSMRKEDAAVIQRWYTGMGTISKYDLDITLSVFPASLKGFYIGEYQGQVVASAVRVPWGDNICYGSYYYVEKEFRTRGFGLRLRDEVAREHVGDRILCVDAVEGKVTENNIAKFGYTQAFRTGRFKCTAKSSYSLNETSAKILPVDQVDFDKLIDYDNKSFVSQNFAPRREFLRLWTQVPGGATYVAQDDGGHVIGYGCRRPAIPPSKHLVGPLYAENVQVAEAILTKLCSDVSGDEVTLQIWYHNEDASAMLKRLEFENVFDVNHQHINGDPHHQKNHRVFAPTCIDLCGF